jgi:serine/threonine protein kinase
VHKLGHGSYSTVWLAWNALRQTVVALKMLRADASEKIIESVILARFAAGQADHPGRAHVAALIDYSPLQDPTATIRRSSPKPLISVWPYQKS